MFNNIDPGAVLSADLLLQLKDGRGVEIGHGAVLEENVIIGNHVQLGSHSHVSLGTRLGEGVRVRDNARVGRWVDMGAYAHVGRNASIGNNVHIGAASHVGMYSVIGEGVIIPPRVRLADRAVILDDRTDHIWAWFGKYRAGGYWARGDVLGSYRLMVRYGCETRPLEYWKGAGRIEERCRYHEPYRHEWYTRKLSEWVSFVEDMLDEPPPVLPDLTA